MSHAQKLRLVIMYQPLSASDFIRLFLCVERDHLADATRLCPKPLPIFHSSSFFVRGVNQSIS